jgi:DNA-binding NtrC family response regulator
MNEQTILIVDDQDEFSRYVRQFLEQEGFEVIVAKDGHTGLGIAQKHQIDLVVLDLTMPDIDGLKNETGTQLVLPGEESNCLPQSFNFRLARSFWGC